ncbi:VRR-NUC domain-containing protein [Variovorax sp. RA8]|uniref:VRR-NUC domain-containing protein n=1 Tax=Variovorax sp. (strain JCM 16519 / RA8) TaxID=662548 RepID=UPI0013164183|nr:VRR-NUC domain-containing protein [Variovorax sp. RA8]VTU44923.1 VRR-NUC domain protein [Variovorax sp. RA8]
MSAAFQRMSAAEYRARMGLAPAGTPEGELAPERLRVRGGALALVKPDALADAVSNPNPVALAPDIEAPARSRKPRKLTLTSGHPTEDQIHRACADWVFAHEGMYPFLRWLMHVPNGGLRSRGEAGKMRAMGVRKGVVDWILPFPSPAGRYTGLAIEVKSHRGTVSDEQQDFLDDAAAAGWLAAVARSSDEFVKVVEQWIRERP